MVSRIAPCCWVLRVGDEAAVGTVMAEMTVGVGWGVASTDGSGWCVVSFMV